MNKFIRKITAVLTLVLFGATFVALETHGANLCDPSFSNETVVMKAGLAKIEASSHFHQNSSSSHHKKDKDCHCSNSSNCSVVSTVQSSMPVLMPIALRYVSVKDQALSMASEGLIKPPRA